MSTPHGSTVYPAPPATLPADLSELWVHRHLLPADVLRTLADVWICASAVRMPAVAPDRFWDDDPGFFARHDTVTCSLRTALPDRPGTAGPRPPLPPDPHAAVDQVFARRHRLTAGELFTVQRCWCCASAAQWGAPHERFWTLDLDGADLLSTHDIADCES
ncbi:hypothetical protein [Pseudonocardia sp. HH130629-09]|uniref:hypothetical protein n=1 Tax=Pseudonocardia sp. HH130629-09 TaxID=1641402 RepID=UPI0006CB427F|nr:hypothetical protein [Pseudonocardia sp. HH130629-09]ALE86606.1 hypothetical protein XF36_28745 [Pseudonocardia sp. HH130629-09]